jgi:aminoglycoside 6'-N-acetyltransferase
MCAAAADVPTLAGELVRLRPVTMTDAPRLVEILTDPVVAEWWGEYDMEKVRAELIEPDDETVVFAVEADGQVIGLIQYLEEATPDYRSAGIDISLHPD